MIENETNVHAQWFVFYPQSLLSILIADNLKNPKTRKKRRNIDLQEH